MPLGVGPSRLLENQRTRVEALLLWREGLEALLGGISSRSVCDSPL